MQFIAVLIRIIRNDGVFCTPRVLCTRAGDYRRRTQETHFEHHGCAVNLLESPSLEMVLHRS